jgi:hypothetical protein
MPSPDSVKQIVFRPQHDGRGVLEITLESGTAYQRDIPSDPFMRAIADVIKSDIARAQHEKQPAEVGGS